MLRQFFTHKFVDTHKEDSIIVVVADKMLAHDDNFLETIVNATEGICLLIHLFRGWQTEC